MNKAIMKKWVKALRSGKYKQGRHVLKQITEEKSLEYCCLGVLCDLYDKHKKNEPLNQCLLNVGYVYQIEYDTAQLPSKVRKWAGLDTGTGDIDSLDNSLAGLNDRGKTFKQIANIIEKHWDEL